MADKAGWPPNSKPATECPTRHPSGTGQLKLTPKALYALGVRKALLGFDPDLAR